MHEFCTCGAQLPPDARFCHKCGKPQRDEPFTEVVNAADESLPVTTLPALAPAPIAISFRDPIALRVGFLTAGLVCLLLMIPGVNYAWIVWLLGAGYFSVWVYKRRTGRRLTVRGGAHLGWITGVLSFGIVALLLAFTTISIEQMGIAVIREKLHELSVQQNALDEFMKMMQSPMEIVRWLMTMFILMTLTCTAGGAIGAKLLSKD
jgi:zinc-ribbon domain